MTETTRAAAAPRGLDFDGLLVGTVQLADGANRIVGAVTAWLTLGTVLACFATVYSRYALGMNFIWLQEIYIWQHAAVILLGAGYTMMTGGFVRVDVFYATWSDRRRAIADMVMTVLVFAPFLWLFSTVSWRFFATAFGMGEGSMNPGGLPNLWILKAAVVAFCVLIGLQGLAILARGTLVLRGRTEWALAHGSNQAH